MTPETRLLSHLAHTHTNEQDAMLTRQMIDELQSKDRAELIRDLTNMTITQFLDQHADVRFNEVDKHGIGRRFPYLGDCLSKLDWGHASIAVVYTGRHNLLVASPSDWPEYPGRELTLDEFEKIERILAKAYYASFAVASGTDLRRELIHKNFDDIWEFVQQLNMWEQANGESQE